jgi:Sec-independent protein translocase protein TatA
LITAPLQEDDKLNRQIGSPDMDAVFCSLLVLVVVVLLLLPMQSKLRESQKWIKTNVKERKQSNLTNDSCQREILATKQLLR